MRTGFPTHVGGERFGATSPPAASPTMTRMDETLPPCPRCSCEYTYEVGALLVCPECAHEWAAAVADATDDAGDGVVRDAVGNVLADGDTVTVVKTLKVKGSPTGIKAGTKVRNIRLVNGVGDHDIDCKVDGIGPMQLKSSVVKKV
ncbi:phosphonoacetate hydrolase [Rhodococcus tukisamuensis]|uniref:Phosphonoacetate hydrolase n=2 Tax=Rhodococcus tukisamuensis TaxID=168276 RepID=A0A1G6RJK5_9NOCA|nr:phosphonoacetate hydrolase [Rhodococcus tukisamuensis]